MVYNMVSTARVLIAGITSPWGRDKRWHCTAIDQIQQRRKTVREMLAVQVSASRSPASDLGGAFFPESLELREPSAHVLLVARRRHHASYNRSELRGFSVVPSRRENEKKNSP